MFEVAEFPVATNGVATRIDFILRRRKSYGDDDKSPFYLVAECKRANPALSNWGFVKAPFVRRDRTHEPYILEHVEIDKTGTMAGTPHACGISYSTITDAYHVALEVRSGEKGDSTGTGRGAIEEAATQVCRGLNGLVATVLHQFQIPGDANNADFLPVIFTTANLWVTSADLKRSELVNGNIDLTKYQFEQKPWIVLQYHMSPALKYDLILKYSVDGLAGYMDCEYIRSIPIVSSSAIPEFFFWASRLDRVR